MTDIINDNDTAVIEAAEQVVSVAASRLDPYSTTGFDVSGIDDMQEILDAAGAGFKAYSATPQVLTDDGVVDVPAKVILRDDDHSVLGIHKPGYEMIQYAQVAELALEVAGLRPADAELAKVGTFKEGAAFFAAVELPSLVIDPDGIADEVKRYVTAFTSHDGSLAVMLVPAFVRLFCQNQLPAVRAQARSEGFCAKHTKNMFDKLALAKQAMGLADAAEAAFIEQAEKLLGTPATKTNVEQLVNKLWKPPAADASDRAKTVAESRMNIVQSLFEAETNSKGVGFNNWAAYNAVTEYLDHGRGTSVEKRAVATIIPNGHIEQKKSQALQILLAA